MKKTIFVLVLLLVSSLVFSKDLKLGFSNYDVEVDGYCADMSVGSFGLNFNDYDYMTASFVFGVNIDDSLGTATYLGFNLSFDIYQFDILTLGLTTEAGLLSLQPSRDEKVESYDTGGIYPYMKLDLSKRVSTIIEYQIKLKEVNDNFMYYIVIR